MIKMFYIFILLCCMAPFNGHTEEFLQTKNSFLLVKAVKLGRSSVESNNILSSTAGKNELLKKCDPNCSNCNKVTGECLACDSGRFLNDNLCLVCPKNASCSDGKTFKCVAGYYQNGKECTLCSAGYYSAAGATNCSSCPAGTFSSAGSAGCTNCPTGTFSSGSAAACINCPANCSSCNSSGLCTVCKTGYFLNSGSCSQCPTNSICNATSFSCKAGYYKDGNYCTSCPKGTISSAGATYCSTCPAGTYASAGTSCVTCPAGTYSRGAVTSCSSCSQNCTSCTSDTQCTQCETGYTLQNGKCVKLNLVCCPNCSICDSSTGICSKCEIGRYYNAALNECMPCPYGCARCPDFNSCTNCYTGFTLRGGVCTNRGNGSLVDALY